MTVSVLFCLFISFVVCVFAKPLLLIFVQPHETEILKVGMSYLRIEGAFTVGSAVCFCSMPLPGSEKTGNVRGPDCDFPGHPGDFSLCPVRRSVHWGNRDLGGCAHWLVFSRSGRLCLL